MLAEMHAVGSTARESWAVMCEMAPYLLFGFLRLVYSLCSFLLIASPDSSAVGAGVPVCELLYGVCQCRFAVAA